MAMGVAAFALVLACGGAGPAAVVEEDGRGVLFVGNSLTYANDLPEMVRALALASGETLRVEMVANPDWSLEDHWNGGGARAAIRRGGWEVVVLQQGPSSLPESRTLLIDYARRFAGEIRAAGATPALYAVWPSLSRSGDFDRATESYRLAAEEVDAMLFPAGEAWRAAWRADPGLQLYAADGLHPSVAGTYAAALVICAGLLHRSPVGSPSTLNLRDGTIVRIDPAVAEVLQRAAATAIAGDGGG
ncbi:SGNH/GDSL hydrolase family protein [Longimicrobium sp.]|uniref:SGNH/GDSL hydrolase family protein n=1 Tax=Longimicrobium sp. TaxID=2029185 RepID=UPI002CD0985C|nr:SGNH/GDSL hydrolase family protein [Longimicrobium sp.]HSU17585.1 SGNH/GDSL hydrolase family protein [Longimicrobium sp.]